MSGGNGIGGLAAAALVAAWAGGASAGVHGIEGFTFEGAVGRRR
ncbi:MAG TPA: hypothetical protein VFG47_11685 [Geminicoccaceae bacterium]|nr:hypothetical protein [Geminicoccaceae bacterium]